MLVLTRKEQQAIIIDDIRIVVVKTKTGSVRIGIEAPPERQIIREELLWNENKNVRRCQLVDKEIDGHITDEEKIELKQLQQQMRSYILANGLEYEINKAKKCLVSLKSKNYTTD